MNKDQIKKEVERQLHNAEVLDCKYVSVAVESLQFLKDEAFKNAKKPVWDKNFGHLCKECGNIVQMDENYCPTCGCEQDWEGLMDECF